MFTGSMTALITPFKNEAVDLDAFKSLCEWQIGQGTSGLVPCGTTGEAPTLSPDEQRTVITAAVEIAKGRVPVVAGVGANSTALTIERAQMAQKAGADALLVVVPYYNKPSQQGMILHYKAVHDACDLPIIIYNIPGRSAADMSVDTMAELAHLPRIAGVKDATSDLARVARLRLLVEPDFAQLSGEDATAVGFNAMGGVGCISVTSNIAPDLCARLQAATFNKDYEQALQLQDQLIELHRAMFCETSPAPVKYAAHLLGLCAPDLRLPLAPLSDQGKKTVQSAMEKAGLC
ncbi:4-hydroxy-tetrahydrodipicolinate synthase [Iodidimonas sp. MBR-22]|jgi:4-hydroxy-tetrahydrodipicolinate synthase|uniref:4-hydroxy-tetrahydrodipicolinate synthase n=1 Tax=unclassified Iodidimonas TaxID=2626145 RepID=UPI0032B25D88